MYKVQIGSTTKLSRVFYFDESTFNSFFGCTSAEQFNAAARQAPYTCRVLSTDKITVPVSDSILSELYIAEYIISDYGNEHKALTAIRSDISKSKAFYGYMDTISLKSVENVQYAIKLYTDYVRRLLKMVDTDADRYKRRKAFKAILSEASKKNAVFYAKKGGYFNGNSA